MCGTCQFTKHQNLHYHRLSFVRKNKGQAHLLLVILHVIPWNKQEVFWNISGPFAEGICFHVTPGKNADAKGGKKILHSHELHPRRIFSIKIKVYKLNYELSL